MKKKGVTTAETFACHTQGSEPDEDFTLRERPDTLPYHPKSCTHRSAAANRPNPISRHANTLTGTLLIVMDIVKRNKVELRKRFFHPKKTFFSPINGEKINKTITLTLCAP